MWPTCKQHGWCTKAFKWLQTRHCPINPWWICLTNYDVFKPLKPLVVQVLNENNPPKYLALDMEEVPVKPIRKISLKWWHFHCQEHMPSKLHITFIPHALTATGDFIPLELSRQPLLHLYYSSKHPSMHWLPPITACMSAWRVELIGFVLWATSY